MLRRKTKYRLCAAAFAIMLIWVAVFGAYSGFQTRTIRVENYAARYQSAEQGDQGPGEAEIFESLWQRTMEDPVAFFTLVLCCFTAALFGAAVLQFFVLRATDKTTRAVAVAARHSADAARGSLIHTQRAFVFVARFEKVGKLVKNLSPGITIIRAWRLNPVWENAGTTPTKRMIAHVSLKFFDGDPPDGFYLQDVHGQDASANKSPVSPQPAFVGPKASALGEAVVAQVWDLKKLSLRGPRAFIWGWADYDDIFDDTKRHRTEFCYEIFMTGNPEFTEPSFRAYPQHNGADEECLRPPKPYHGGDRS